MSNKNKSRLIKRLITGAMCLTLVFSINGFASVVSDNDGSAFITKAEFDSLKNNFQAQIDQYNQSIDSKIDGAIAAYLSGIQLSVQEVLELDYWDWKFPIKKLKNNEIYNCTNGAYGAPKILLERFAMGTASSNHSAEKKGSKFNYQAATELKKTVQSTTTPFDRTFYEIGGLKDSKYAWNSIPYEHFELQNYLLDGKYVTSKANYGYYDYSYRTKDGEQGWVGISDVAEIKIVTDGSIPIVTDNKKSQLMGAAENGSFNGNIGTGYALTTAAGHNMANMDFDPDYFDPSKWDFTTTIFNNYKDIVMQARGTQTPISSTLNASNLGLYTSNFVTQDTKRRYIYDAEAYLYANQQEHDGWRISTEPAEWLKFGNASNPTLAVDFLDPWTFAYKFYNAATAPEWKVYVVPTHYTSITTLSGPWLPLKEEDKAANGDNFSAVKANKVVYEDKSGSRHNMGEGLYMLTATGNGTLTFKIKFGNADGTGALNGKLKIAKKGFNETLTTGDIYNLTINNTTAKEQSIGTGIDYLVKVNDVKKNEQLFLMWYEDTTDTNIQIEEIKELILIKE